MRDSEYKSICDTLCEIIQNEKYHIHIKNQLCTLVGFRFH